MWRAMLTNLSAFDGEDGPAAAHDAMPDPGESRVTRSISPVRMSIE
jgi:hypothetical protein